MRTIRRTATFKRDYRREIRGRFARATHAALARILADLVEDRPLAQRHRDHALGGQWKDHRDCHLRPNLVLIYRKPDAEHLDLVRLGSHSQLGL